MALASVLWWNEDSEEAIAELTEVAEASKPESELRLDLAELLDQQGERALALAMADSVQPLDNTRMRRREELALRLSVLNGDLERARQAAERLFGLRLDTDTQIRLAGQMHQLGLHALAEAVLGRARRRAGNQAGSLAGLMVQYQRQGQLDVAVQIAMQILRSTNAARPTLSSTLRVANAVDPNRTAADQRAGSVGPAAAVDRAAARAGQEDAEVDPASSDTGRLLPGLGQRDKATAELAGVVELRPTTRRCGFRSHRNSCRRTRRPRPSSTTRCCSRKTPRCWRGMSTRSRIGIPADGKDRRADWAAG